MRAIAIIPARLAATRLPNKPLVDIAGKPMIQRVYERALQARSVGAVLVATPDEAIANVVRGFGGQFAMTRADHQTGTDRIAEAVAGLDADVIVNVQGDEPLIEPETIDAVADALLRDPSVAMSTLCTPLPAGRESDPNAVKTVVTQDGFALYFSRAPIPYRRNADAPYRPWLHCGLYAYRRDFLMAFPALPRTPLEQAESLEQLRALEHGYRIKVVFSAGSPDSVDTAEDLERVRAAFVGGVR